MGMKKQYRQRYRSKAEQMARAFCTQHNNNMRNDFARIAEETRPSCITEIAKALNGWIQHELPAFARKVLSIQMNDGLGSMYFSIATIRGMHEHRNEGTIWLYADHVTISSNVEGVGGHYDYGDPKLFDQLKTAIMRLYNGASGKLFR